jgi:hypothetical protein
MTGIGVSSARGIETMLHHLPIEDTSFSFSNVAPSPPDRRRDTRHMRILRVGTLVLGSRRELCLIRNISAGGMMAHVYSPVELDQEVSIALKSHHLLRGRVVWVHEDGNVGIEFDDPIDVEAMLSHATLTDNGWLPRMPRVEVDWLATVRADSSLHWVTVRDISQGGVKLECDRPLDPGQPVVLTIDKFRSVKGAVRWCDGGAAGIAFNELIPFQELMGWLRAN